MNPPDAPFEAPWQAQAFALVVSLAEAGIITWADWTDALSRTIRRDGAPDDGHDAYYRHWLTALEGLLGERGIALPADVDALAASWERAAHATPHGQPIELANDPQAV